MENQLDTTSTENPVVSKKPKNENMISVDSNSRNIIVVALVLFLILALLGFNLLNFTGNILEQFFSLIRRMVLNTLEAIGFITGSTLNATAEVASDTAKETIDIAEGTIQSVGILLQNKDNINDNSVNNN